MARKKAPAKAPPERLRSAGGLSSGQKLDQIWEALLARGWVSDKPAKRTRAKPKPESEGS